MHIGSIHLVYTCTVFKSSGPFNLGSLIAAFSLNLDKFILLNISSEGIYKLKQCLDLTVVRLIFNNGGTVFWEKQYCRKALKLQVMLCIFFVVAICTEPANLLTGVCKFLWVSIMYSFFPLHEICRKIYISYNSERVVHKLHHRTTLLIRILSILFMLAVLILYTRYKGSDSRNRISHIKGL